MSYKLQALVWGHPALTATERLVMLYLADRASDDGGRVFPSVRVVAEATGLGERTVQSAMRACEEEGFLVLVGNEGGGRPGTTRQYRIVVTRLNDRTGANAAPVSKGEGRVQPARRRVRQMRGTGANAAPKPSVKHQGNTKRGTRFARARRAKAAGEIGADWKPENWCLEQATATAMEAYPGATAEQLAALLQGFVEKFRDANLADGGSRKSWDSAFLGRLPSLIRERMQSAVLVSTSKSSGATFAVDRTGNVTEVAAAPKDYFG